MRMDKQDQEAIETPGTVTGTVEMTPEVKERIKRAALAVNDAMRATTDNPLEAYIVLREILSFMEKEYGIRGRVIVEDIDVTPGA